MGYFKLLLFCPARRHCGTALQEQDSFIQGLAAP
jgi:hypothetical protein